MSVNTSMLMDVVYVTVISATWVGAAGAIGSRERIASVMSAHVGSDANLVVLQRNNFWQLCALSSLHTFPSTRLGPRGTARSLGS
jgi:hypothetical protein